MHHITSELAVNAIGNRYDLVLVASRRARELNAGWKPKIINNSGSVVTALEEIEVGHIGRDYLLKPTNLHRKEPAQ
jgi:DNA-directed RNA polymerase subunit omega